MSFVEDIVARFEATRDKTVLWELHDTATSNQASWGVSGRGLLRQIAEGRGFLSARGLKKGDRCALLAANSIEWVAMDRAIMAEALFLVPLYPRPPSSLLRI